MINRVRIKPVFIFMILMIPILILVILAGCGGQAGVSREEATSINEEEITSEEVIDSNVSSKEQVQTSEETTQGKITIAVISPILNHPWYQRCKEGATKAAKDLGIEVIFEGPQEVDVENQLSIFNNMIGREVDAILISAIDPKLFGEPINDAISKGIPVFSFDAGAPDTDILFSASGFEPRTTGKLIGEGLAKDIGEKGKVVILTSVLEQKDLKERREAIAEALEQYDGIEILGVYANENDFVKGLTQCQSLLEAHDDLAGFASDMELGVTVASQAVLDKGLGGEVAIWGIGMPQQNSEFIKGGIARGILTFDPADMTYIGVMIAYRYLKEGVLPEEGDEFSRVEGALIVPEDKTVYAPLIQLTPENVDNFDF